MARIRAEVAKRKLGASIQGAGGDEGTMFSSGVSAQLNPLPSGHLPRPSFVSAERYHLNDFLALHDQDFINAVYQGVLKRSPDGPGQLHFLSALRSGSLSKIEILGRLRYSPEGRRLRVPVAGLLPALVAQHSYRMPMLGGILAWLVALVRLPRMARSLQGFENYQHQRNGELEISIQHLAQVATANERHLGQGVDRNALAVSALKEGWAAAQGESAALLTELSREISTNIERLSHADKQRMAVTEQRIAAFESNSTALKSQFADLVSRHELLQERLTALELYRQEIKPLLEVAVVSQQTSAQLTSMLREALSAMEGRLDGLSDLLVKREEEARVVQSRLTERVARVEGRVHERRQLASLLSQDGTDVVSASEQGVARAGKPPAKFDELYFAFEQRFRGSREEIRKRLAYYLPLLRESVVCKEGATVLDIGCGRGEWLELLRDESIDARGVDTNPEMANECIGRGLNVGMDDAILYLKRLPDNALGAVTGFHIIEHVPLDTLIELIEEAHRVVQPGGLVIFETPNPENVVVGACNFYIDPTHQRPLPPVLMQFLVEAGGFAEVTIHRVNAELLPRVLGVPGDEDPPALRAAVNYLNGKFLCAPDYSVVGRVA
jgi:SAM-dependent methyltransferase